MKRLGGVLLLLVLLIPAATAATINIGPDAIAPGDTVMVNVSGLPDGAAFSLGIRGEFAAAPGEAFAFTIRDLTLPFSLNSGEMNAYTRGTTWTELVAELPDGGSVIMRYNADSNNEVRISQPRNFLSGTFGAITLRGEAAASDIVADLTVLGTKQGPEGSTISFAIEGITSGTVTVTVYVDGVEALSQVIPVGAYPTPIPTPTPLPTQTLTPTPTQTPPISGALAIVSNKDVVIRGHSFVATITGEPIKDYHLFVEEVDGLGPGEYPVVALGQVGVMSNSPIDVTVRTNAAGTRSIQFNTNQSTDTRAFTIRVEDPADLTVSDDVEVKIERGDVTITASGTGVYYLGEEITLSGTNSDSDTTYLFLTGPNLPANGVRLSDVTTLVENGDPATFTRVYVEADDTWSYKWNTADVGRRLNASGYTIYAAAQPQGKGNLTGVRLATTSIVLRAPSLTIQPSGATLTPGDDYRVSGIATGAPTAVQVWILGPDYYHSGAATVESDGTFECVLAGADTSNLTEGRYYVIVQHPGCNGFDVWVSNPDPLTISGNGIIPVVLGNLGAADAAGALINALDSPNVDDIYAKFSFVIDESWIWIDGVSDLTYGETFIVTGVTGFPAGTVLTYRITANEDGANVFSGEVVVTDDGGWNLMVDTAVIGPGAYTLHVTAPGGQASAIALFDVYDDVTHPAPPGGGSYRLERLGVTPPLDSLSPGEGAVLDGIIRPDDTINSSLLDSGTLEFSTDLQGPIWSYTLRVDGNLLYTEPVTVNARSFTLSGWDLDYQGDVRILLTLSGTVPPAGTGNPALLRILERDAAGRTVPNSEYRLLLPLIEDDPAPLPGDNLTLSPGWNFVSIPRPLAAGNDTAAIFAGVDVDGHSALRYDTANRSWINLKPTDCLAPLEGIWIYSAVSTTVPLNFSADPLVSPAERPLSAGWSAIGVTGTAPATARDTLYSVNGQWTTLIGYDAGRQAFETGIVNGGSGANADTRSVYPGRGYWLYMTGPGTLCAIGA